jgi:broad specificity phosphatase PhoE
MGQSQTRKLNQQKLSTSSESKTERTSECEVWIIRHGERIDETEIGRQWYYTTSKTRRFDPTLTETGASQAQQSAKTLQHLILGNKITSLQNDDDDSIDSFFDTIYCSPMQRCISTAHEVTSTLNKSNDSRFHCPNGIKIIPGLGECANAGRVNGVDNLEFLSPQEMMNLCPGTILSETNCWDKVSPRTYEAALDWIVNNEINKTRTSSLNSNKTLPSKRILIVAHSEAIRDLTGSYSKIPYCGIALFHAAPLKTISITNNETQGSSNDDVEEDNKESDIDSREERKCDDKFQYLLHHVFDPMKGDIVPLVF